MISIQIDDQETATKTKVVDIMAATFSREKLHDTIYKYK